MKTFLMFFTGIVITVASPETEKKIFCTHGKWSHYRSGNGQFGIDQIDPSLCTHLIYTFFGINTDAEIVIRDTWLDLEDNYGLGNLKKLSKLKEINPNLKTLAAIGGWSEGTEAFSKVANDPVKRGIFVKNCMDFVEKYDFDGLDLDWEYPGQRDGNKTTDKEAFTLLVKELATALHSKKLLLTALVAPERYSFNVAYDIPQISKHLDFMKLKTYDMHGSWGSKIGNNSPLYAKAAENNMEKLMNMHTGVFDWINSGAPAEKLIVGVSTYGRGFKMISRDKNTPLSPHGGASEAGPYTSDPGMLGYNELCEKRLTEAWKDHWDEEQMVPYTTRGDQWIGYENEESLRIKARYIRMYKLGGIMVANIETDDFKGFCGRGKFPLLNEVKKALKEKSPYAPRERKVCINTIKFS
ncbi:chitinase-3-like protein 1 [Phlebotomus argentipes]|uniref:chitinase-3-like protein 1 n=1 Tax=Phlebotomus argentipes TaxID=94469 RepID=UPI0028930442|nr:chitinase-3-like protein 1 [Phlebotomus argentipes]